MNFGLHSVCSSCLNIDVLVFNIQFNSINLDNNYIHVSIIPIKEVIKKYFIKVTVAEFLNKIYFIFNEPTNIE